MDPVRFDGLATALAAAGNRRRLLSLLSALPVAGALAKLLDEESAAKRRRQGRKTHNHRHSGRRKDNRKGKRKKDKNTSSDSRQAECARLLGGAGCFVDGPSDARYIVCPPGTVLDGMDLHGCIMVKAQLTGASVTGATFAHANLQGANLSGATGDQTWFDYADLRGGAKLIGAILTKARFPWTSLEGADFTGAIMEQANLCRTYWTDAVGPNGEKLDFFTSRDCCGRLNGYHTSLCATSPGCK